MCRIILNKYLDHATIKFLISPCIVYLLTVLEHKAMTLGMSYLSCGSERTAGFIRGPFSSLKPIASPGTHREERKSRGALECCSSRGRTAPTMLPMLNNLKKVHNTQLRWNGKRRGVDYHLFISYHLITDSLSTTRRTWIISLKISQFLPAIFQHFWSSSN